MQRDPRGVEGPPEDGGEDTERNGVPEPALDAQGMTTIALALAPLGRSLAASLSDPHDSVPGDGLSQIAFVGQLLGVLGHESSAMEERPREVRASYGADAGDVGDSDGWVASELSGADAPVVGEVCVDIAQSVLELEPLLCEAIGIGEFVLEAADLLGCLVDPGDDISRIEADKLPDLEERDPALIDEAAYESFGDAEPLSEGGEVEERCDRVRGYLGGQSLAHARTCGEVTDRLGTRDSGLPKRRVAAAKAIPTSAARPTCSMPKSVAQAEYGSGHSGPGCALLRPDPPLEASPDAFSGDREFAPPRAPLGWRVGKPGAHR